MTDKAGDGDNAQKSRKIAAREARLASALRANLRRRKAQTRGRGAPTPPEARTTAEPAADE